MVQGNDPIDNKCDICGKNFISNYKCSNGHNLCTECLSRPMLAEARKICTVSTSKNPLEIAEEIMDSPAFSLVGCSHYLVAIFAILTAYRNSGGKVPSMDDIVKRVHPRTALCPTSMCKIGGFCGVPLCLGITLIGLMEISDKSWESLREIANNMTRTCTNEVMSKDNTGSIDCCKRNTFLTIVYASRFISSNLWVDMELPQKVYCKYSEGNPRCKKDTCGFYTGWRTDHTMKKY